jgi:hypothetical protein
MGFGLWRKIAGDKYTWKLTQMEPGSEGSASGEEGQVIAYEYSLECFKRIAYV